MSAGETLIGEFDAGDKREYAVGKCSKKQTMTGFSGDRECALWYGRCEEGGASASLYRRPRISPENPLRSCGHIHGLTVQRRQPPARHWSGFRKAWTRSGELGCRVGMVASLNTRNFPLQGSARHPSFFLSKFSLLADFLDFIYLQPKILQKP